MNPYYSNGGIEIYHGDCREVLPVDCDLLVTDPPYGVALDTGKLNRIGKPSGYEWHGVEESGGVDVELLLSLNVPSVIFGANFFSDVLPRHPGWVVWDKQADGFAQGSPVELAWTNYLNNIRVFRRNYRGFTTRGDPKVHPMQKPTALFSWIFSLAETPPGKVLDPYMGSGAVLVAAKREGRPAVGVEVEEAYCEAAVERLSQGSLLG